MSLKQQQRFGYFSFKHYYKHLF